jgi:hypothetical protein
MELISTPPGYVLAAFAGNYSPMATAGQIHTVYTHGLAFIMPSMHACRQRDCYMLYVTFNPPGAVMSGFRILPPAALVGPLLENEDI